MHSKATPWTIELTTIPDPEGELKSSQIRDSEGHWVGTFPRDTGKLIVACVNALAGRNPEALAPLMVWLNELVDGGPFYRCDLNKFVEALEATND